MSLFFEDEKFEKEPKTEKIILNDARKSKGIIYGARSIQKQTGFLPLFQRKTEDFDVFVGNPKAKANKIQAKLDKVYNRDQFYSKPARHKGTYKVMNKGKDGMANTSDDFGVVDYSKYPKPRPKVKKIGGVYYRVLSQEENAKRKAIADKSQKFRWQKDNQDLLSIKYYKTIKVKGGKKRL